MANLANSEDFPGNQVAKTSPFIEGVQVLSLDGKLRAHVPHGQKTKTLKKKKTTRSNIITNSIQTLKMAHIF